MPLVGLNGDLSLEETQAKVLQAVNSLKTLSAQLLQITSQADQALTNDQLRESAVAISNAVFDVVGSGTGESAQRVQLSTESLQALENITVRVGEIEITNDIGNPVLIDGKVQALSPLVPSEYDSIELGYSGEILSSVLYKSGLNTVSTLSLSYTNGLLTGVKRV